MRRQKKNKQTNSNDDFFLPNVIAMQIFRNTDLFQDSLERSFIFPDEVGSIDSFVEENSLYGIYTFDIDATRSPTCSAERFARLLPALAPLPILVVVVVETFSTKRSEFVLPPTGVYLFPPTCGLWWLILSSDMVPKQAVNSTRVFTSHSLTVTSNIDFELIVDTLTLDTLVTYVSAPNLVV